MSRRIWGRLLGGALGLGLFLGTADFAAAQEPDLRIVRSKAARRFVVLPVEANQPEGIAANPLTKELFVGTIDPGGDNFLLRLDRRGKIVARLPLGPLPLLGLAFNPRDSMVYAAVPGNVVQQPSRIARVAADFDEMSVLEDVAIVPGLPTPPPRMEANIDGSMDTITFGNNISLPNGLVFRESDGALFFTDSFQAAVFQIQDPSLGTNICPDSSECVSTVVQEGLLATAGVPQVGANGLAFNADESVLFIANTGDDRILSLDLLGDAGLSVFLEGINGPDGLIAGPGNTLIATANQADQIVVIDADTGSVLAELGEFFGTLSDGTPLGLSVPASVVLVGRSLFVTNLGRPVPPDAMQPADVLSRIRFPRRLLVRPSDEAPGEPDGDAEMDENIEAETGPDSEDMDDAPAPDAESGEAADES